MKGLSRMKRTLRGEVRTRTAALEAVRRMNSALMRRRERAQLDQLNRQPARLILRFARMSHAELLNHFRQRQSPRFFPGFADVTNTARVQREMCPNETKQLLVQAARIAKDHCWPLLGFGEKCFGEEEINWNRDPLSGYKWPLDYHSDISLFRSDGSDARVQWELNRLSHLITLGRAYVLTHDESFAKEFLRQVRSWRSQNPVGRGVNWACAMEVALRAMNLLAAFSLFQPSSCIDEDALVQLLMIFDHHGAHIRRNLEYSHIATSNHYMCDVTGLLWLGLMFPEFQDASEWREFGLRELLNEVDKQILSDGADSESSTGYHRLKLELLLYSFVLCRANGIDIDEKYWQKLRAMGDFTRAYLRPDGRAPLIGDSDSGQILPIAKRAGDDHAYVLCLAAAALPEANLKFSKAPSEELVLVLGEEGLQSFQSLHIGSPAEARAFSDAGIYVLRNDDLYLLFNTSGCGLNGRGSHGHNDALGIEVSACGTSFIIDPGSYVYTANLHERHLFRSTAAHSTVQADGVEQNTTDETMPFVIGDEAHPRVVRWETNSESEDVMGNHNGYRRLSHAVIHRRSIRFEKSVRYWLIEDSLSGEGTHNFAFRFHSAPGLDVQVTADGNVELCDKITGACLSIVPLTESAPPVLEPGFASTDYGAKDASTIVSWFQRASVSLRRRWALIPLSRRDDKSQADRLIEALRAEPAVKFAR